jgi:hypothetical protein
MAATMRIEATSGFEWWRPLVQWILCIPHLLYTGLLSGLALVCVAGIGASVLLTGKVPAALGRLVVLSLRERVRCYTYFFVLRTDRPPYPTSPFEFDPGDDPRVELTIPLPATLPRSAAFRVFTVLPHVLVLGPIGLVMDLLYPVWMVVAAVGRGWSPGATSFLLRVEHWVAAVIRYAAMVSDERPRFGLAAYGDPSVPSGELAVAG